MLNGPNFSTPLVSRREVLSRIGGGFGGMALASLLGHTDASGTALHHRPTAKRVIQIFCPGGMSHVDTFDYKPELERRTGKL